MSPMPTGSRTAIMTMGIVLVASLIAVTPCVPHDTMRLHLEPDQLGRQVGQPVDPILRISIVDDNILALNPPELAQPLPERIEQGRPIGRRRHPKKTYPRHLSRLLRVGGERRGEETHGEDSDEGDTPDHHAATAVCWFNTAPIFCQ